MAALRRLIPEIRAPTSRARAPACARRRSSPTAGSCDDFLIVEAERMIHVLNAPSPAATASITIGRTIAAQATERFGLRAARRLRPGRRPHDFTAT